VFRIINRVRRKTISARSRAKPERPNRLETKSNRLQTDSDHVGRPDCPAPNCPAPNCPEPDCPDIEHIRQIFYNSQLHRFSRKLAKLRQQFCKIRAEHTNKTTGESRSCQNAPKFRVVKIQSRQNSESSKFRVVKIQSCQNTELSE
jgi:hypothetical protein